MPFELDFILLSIIAGILATYVLLANALWIHQLGLPRLDFSTVMTKLTYGEQFDGNPPYWPGMLVIYFNGVIFALLYSTVVAQYLPGEYAIIKGAIWGALLWFFSGIFYVPFILREGFMLSHVHPMAWFSSGIVHGMYGLVIGWLAPIHVAAG